MFVPDDFFEYIYHVGCATNSHSITNSGLIPGRQILGRLASYKQKTWTRPRYGVLGRYTTCSTERIEVLSNRIERDHPLRHTPSLLYPEGYHDGNWTNHKRAQRTDETGRESTKNSRTVRLVHGPPSSQSCVPVSVELVDKDEDADENEEEDQTRTERPVSEQPTGSFTLL